MEEIIGVFHLHSCLIEIKNLDMYFLPTVIHATIGVAPSCGEN
jgi:hypothetical protein